MSDYDEKTRVTQVVQTPADGEGGGNDCLVVIYTKEPGLLGKRFVLENTVLRVGRGTDNTIVLEGDSVSRRHAHFERRGSLWFVVDDGSTNGTYVNEEQIPGFAALNNSDRIHGGCRPGRSVSDREDYVNSSGQECGNPRGMPFGFPIRLRR